jgi:hypothetical protein
MARDRSRSSLDDEDEVPASRNMSIDAVFAFLELADDGSDASDTVPEFFAQMTADDNGELELRVVLDATWSAEGAVNGTIEEGRRVVHIFETDYAEKWIELRASDRIAFSWCLRACHPRRCPPGQLFRGRLSMSGTSVNDEKPE